MRPGRSFVLGIAAVLGTITLLISAQGHARPAAIYSHVTHLGWVVRDAEGTAAAWHRLGLRDIAPARDVSFEVSGPSRTTVRVRQVSARMGNVRLDWMTPVGSGGPFSEFLDRHGEGVHHLAVRVPDAASLDREVAAFASGGAGVVGQGEVPGEPQRFAWLDTRSPGGLTLEIEQGAADDPPHAAQNEEPFTRATQFAFVVRDVGAVSRHWETFGFTPLVIEPNVSLDRRYRGQAGTFEMFLGWNRTGDVPFEWIQSTRGPNVYEEYLAAHGEGFHHLGLDVPDMDAAIGRLAARGLSVTMSGGWNVRGYEGRFAYLDTERFGGVTIELLWNKPRPATDGK